MSCPTQDTASGLKYFIYETLTLFGLPSHTVQLYFNSSHIAVLQPQIILVWALPFSLAATKGIDFSFFSSRYLDVSVPWVSPHIAIYSLYDN